MERDSDALEQGHDGDIGADDCERGRRMLVSAFFLGYF
jgi:hypothetical protein